jgi:hypothetical protein
VQLVVEDLTLGCVDVEAELGRERERQMDSDNLEKLTEILRTFDRRTEPFDEHDLAAAIQNAHSGKGIHGADFEWLAEAMAFDFREHFADGDVNTEDTYSPMTILKGEDGSCREWPSVGQITAEVLQYWVGRAKEATHPILKARYAGLAWEFGRRICKQSVDVHMAHIAIEANVAIAEIGSYRYELAVVDKLGHALRLAISVGDRQRTERVRDAIVAYEDKIARDGSPGSWGFAYDLLMEDKKVPMEGEHRQKIIGDLERRLEREARSGGVSRNPWVAQKAAMRLARHYRRGGLVAEVQRVLHLYGAIFEQMAKACSPVVAMKWLQDLELVYREYGLREDVERVLRMIRSLGPGARGELKLISGEVSISKDELERYVKAFTESDIETTLQRIIAHYIPDRSTVEDEVKRDARKYVFQALLPRQIMDHKGRLVASIGAVRDDIEGRVVQRIAQDLSLQAPFLRLVMDRVIGRYRIDAALLLAYLYKSPLFEDAKKDIIAEGLTAYLRKDGLVSIHLLIPQVEDAVRNMAEGCGAPVLRPMRAGGFSLRTLDDLVQDCASVLGEDVVLYLRVLLTDPRGWNVRNDVCHGTLPSSQFGMEMADRVIHALLLLGQVRLRCDDKPEVSGTGHTKTDG